MRVPTPRARSKPIRSAVTAALALALALQVAAKPLRKNGFVLDGGAIPPNEILVGVPERDRIPALTAPDHVRAAAGPWRDSDLVIGVESNGVARAYPIDILIWHELINDSVGGRPILVSYCPLCGTGIVFDRHIGDQLRTFGVSGLLYRSDLLLYDRETESLWSQISSEAVTGPSQGQRLTQVRARMLPWGQWREKHPETTVLSRNTGHVRSYGRSPYGDYERSSKLYFPAPRDERYHPKLPTLGIRIPGGAARAYPSEEVIRAGGTVRERFEERDIRVQYDPEHRVFHVEAPDDVEVVEGFWFAWAAFHPDTTVFRAPREP